jgi:hypothetical protein
VVVKQQAVMRGGSVGSAGELYGQAVLLLRGTGVPPDEIRGLGITVSRWGVILVTTLVLAGQLLPQSTATTGAVEVTCTLT